MREFLDYLEKKNDLLRIKEEMDTEWEINGITKICLQQMGLCLFFEKIESADYLLVANLVTTDNRLLLSLGIEKWSEFNDEWMKRTAKWELIPRMHPLCPQARPGRNPRLHIDLPRKSKDLRRSEQ
ncbi:MAG: UbiD family decarboxylase [Deltaproteobacteria bacterium]|nr:UbiD family decarboxylase [Deltaproteobacteria bacterium]